MNANVASYLTLPTPCGLAISSVTSDGEYLYAVQPDRNTVYKLDVCGRIICVFKLSRKYICIHYCSGKFYATTKEDTRKIYILNKCFREISTVSPEFSCSCNQCNSCNSCASTRNNRTSEYIITGPSGDCTTLDCMLTIVKSGNVYAADSRARPIAIIRSCVTSGSYTAVSENNGVLYEAIEKNDGCGDIVRATLLSDGQSKVMRLPFGFKIRSFFCYGGYLYAFFTKNSFHGFIAPICTFIVGGNLCGEIISLPDSEDGLNCFNESCGTSCSDSCSSCNCSNVSSNQTEMCSSVSGDSTDADDCDIRELCRLFDCIKKLCKNNTCAGSCNGGCNCCGSNCGSCVSGDSVGGCGCGGNLSCHCYPECDCPESEVGGDSCLPLPPCPINPCATPCDETAKAANNAKVTFGTAAGK